MSTLRDPVGPERKSVYVRRRLMVLAGLLAIIAFIVLIIVKPGSSGGAAALPNVPLPDEIVSADKPAASSAGALPTCATGELMVSPITDQQSYAAGELPELRLSVTSTAEAACQADLGTAGMSFVITSGADEVWRSTDCQTDGASQPVILQPGEQLTTEPLVWDRTRSAADTCDDDREAVVSGGATYHLSVAAAGVQSQGTASFLLY